MARRHRQLGLPLAVLPKCGGRRARAGRKPMGEHAGIRHASRPRFAGCHPAHVTLRVRSGVPSLRFAKLVREFERSLTAACERSDFRVVQYSLQSNHVHLLVEAATREALGRGMKAIGARLARAVNRVFQRVGPVLADRYHLHVLRTPSEVRNALRYVLLNGRHHASRLSGRVVLDPASSARWFDGWRRDSVSDSPPTPSPVARARTWLLAVGWMRLGLIDPADVPGPNRARS